MARQKPTASTGRTRTAPSPNDRQKWKAGYDQGRVSVTASVPSRTSSWIMAGHPGTGELHGLGEGEVPEGLHEGESRDGGPGGEDHAPQRPEDEEDHDEEDVAHEERGEVGQRVPGGEGGYPCVLPHGGPPVAAATRPPAFGFAPVDHRDDLLHRRVRDRDVLDVVVAHDQRHHLVERRFAEVDRELGGVRAALQHLHPFGFQAERRVELQVDHLAAQQPVLHVLDRAVPDDAAVVDDDGPPADLLDVPGVVRGEEDRGPLLFVHPADEVADRLLHDHVEADRRLVEEQHLGRVQERGGDLAAHALAERELAHRRAQVFPDPERLDEQVDARTGFRPVQVVDVGEQEHRVQGREVVPELRPLAEDRADASCEGLALAVRVESEHPDGARGGVEDARDELDGGRFARAVRPDEGEHLAALDREGDAIDRAHLFALRMEHGAHRRQEPGRFLPDRERFREVFYVEDGFHGQ